MASRSYGGVRREDRERREASAISRKPSSIQRGTSEFTVRGLRLIWAAIAAVVAVPVERNSSRRRRLRGSSLRTAAESSVPVPVAAAPAAPALPRTAARASAMLLMDEPTTHLDMASIDALIGALTQFEGTIIFISHD